MTDLNSLKKELGKLTDLDYLKAELNRIALEIKKFDMTVTLTPQAKSKLNQLEKRFGDLLKAVNKAQMQIAKMQKQVDREITKFVKKVKQTGLDAENKLRSSVGLSVVAKSGKKTAKKKTTTKKASTVKKASARKTTKKAAAK